MFDLGFLELMICGVIALLILGPERLPGAARAAGQWVGRARRVSRQFTDELDRQVKVDEIRAQLRREESEVGYEDIQRNVQEALDEAKNYEHLILPEAQPREDDLAPADRARYYPKDTPASSPDSDAGAPDSANSTSRQNRDPS
ncbi:MAG: twin-arginine translocase subunit TatB [Halomonadaceae bacterium]|nr:MAG: twin-arginine translocase subunit TatB [Halomonadaceae bacterium]